MAVLSCVQWLLSDRLGLEWASQEGIDHAWRSVTQGEESDRATLALVHAYEWAVAHGHRWHKSGRDVPSQGWAGRWSPEDPWIAFLPQVLAEVLERGGFVPEAMLGQWADLGWLELDGGKRTRRVSLSGKRVRCYCLRLDEIKALVG